ncbi:MAG: tetratricopeptide repeat protein [Planctomycetes bacterium]|nr:tetratricopeptide repeat protein [Planctomycetota bacterium]
MRHLFVWLWLVASFAGLVGQDQALAEAASDLVRQGNSNFNKGDYEQALATYEKASVDLLESPHLFFNKGDVHYRQGNYAKAREMFETAALKTRDIRLEARCKYNLGNCLFREGQRQADSDLHKALEAFQKSVRYYQDALELDGELRDAAHNIEVVRLTIKDILDKLQEQQKQDDQRRQARKETADELKKLIDRQQQAIGRNDELAKSQADHAESQDWTRQVDSLAQDQKTIMEDTKRQAEKLAGQQKTTTQPATPATERARQYLDGATTEQAAAQEELRKRQLKKARPLQKRALQELEKAMEALAGRDNQGRQPQPQQQRPESQPAQQEQAKSPRRDETAREILDEEKENRQRRSLQVPGGMRPVDKDW